MSTHDPNKIVVTFLGNIITGFAADTFVNIARDEEGWFKTVGANGNVCRARNNNKGGKITLTLQQDSLSNDILSAAAALDEQFGTGTGEVMVKDLNGTTLAHAESAWVQKFADAGFGKEVGTREWVIDCGVLEEFIGGIVVP
jgi:hypothetical protein